MEESKSIVIAMAERCRNWGRWGKEDQLGALNYITPDKVTEAATLVCRGTVFPLAIPLDQNGPQKGDYGRINPQLLMRFTGIEAAAGIQPFGWGFGAADDSVFMPLQAGTHWDALSHVFDRGVTWNGFSSEIVTSQGALRNGVENMSGKLISRGVLLDIARYKEVEYLEPGYAITTDDLEGCIQMQGSSVGTGDILLIRTGQMGYCKRNGWGDYAAGSAPGLSFWTAEWLYKSEIATIAGDTWGLEVNPSEFPGLFGPLHQVLIPNTGLVIGEIFDLEALAEDCAIDGVYEFLFIAPPLPVTGAVGSPVNPYAVK